jgi:hypothetical protein
MSTYQGENSTHKGNVQVAESTRQAAVTAAGSSASQALAAELAFYRAVIASAKTNGVPASTYQDALRSLGVWS